MTDLRTPDSAHRVVVGTRSSRARRLDRIDRWAARLIRLGGSVIVLSVIAILVFIGLQVIPLWRGAQVSAPRVDASLNTATPLLQFVDDYKDAIAQIGSDGMLRVWSARSGHAQEPERLADSVTTGSATQNQQQFVLGLSDGSVRFYHWTWKVTYDNGRQVQPAWRDLHRARLFDSSSVASVQMAATETGALSSLALSSRGDLAYYTYDPEWGTESRKAISNVASFGSTITSMALSPGKPLGVVGFADGHAVWLDLSKSQPELLQNTRVSDTAVTALTFLLGGESLVMGDAGGHISRWLAAQSEGSTRRPFRKLDTFKPSARGICGFAVSPRDKGFVSWDSSGSWSIHHATSGRTYQQVPSAGSAATLVTMAPRADGVVAALSSGGLATWDLSNPHPEVTLKTLFGKVWYEGYPDPEFVWQSTGGTDAFEPKLSLVPLLFGTLKGTFYAMLFSVPVSILAAIYVSQLARPRFRAVVKPAIELMAALPSVVVGFIAALWFAPLLERHLIAAMLTGLAVPLFAVLAAPIWQLLPQTWRERLPEGIEPAVAIPFIALGAAGALLLAPIMERAWFGGDVRQWLFIEQGIRFDPRNNIVVGVALGVAVIPIIFTVAEDALSNVPPSLVSGALALGASRWQATWRIVLRAASPGIFAATMLGFGRAVGETMIVLMATGNTPILDWSIFNGMRTMSAAIAVEISEAPVGGTLYRVLFLLALLLFLFTLAVNTAASLVSARLRRRYGRF